MTEQRKRKITQYLYLAVGILAAAFLVIVLIVTWPDQPSKGSDLEKLSFSGEYRLEGGDWQPYAQGVKLDSLQNMSVTMRGKFDRAIAPGEQLICYINYLEVHIIQNGREIYSFGEESSRPPLMQSSGCTWGKFLTEGISIDDELEIRLVNLYSNNSHNAYDLFFGGLYIGDTGNLLRSLLASDAAVVAFGLLIFAIGIVLLTAVTVLRSKKIQIHSSVFLLAWFMLAVSVWSTVSRPYSTLLFHNPPMLMVIETLTISLVVLLLTSYVKSFVVGRERVIATAAEYAAMAFIVFYIVMQLAGVIDAYRVRSYFIGVAGVVTVLMFALTVYELFRVKDRETRFPFLVLTILGVFCVGEMINYEAEIFTTSVLLLIGTIFFCLIQFIMSVRYIVNAVTRAQRAAEIEKELTENRLAMALSQIQPHFLYNSLASIKQLCDTVPEKASKALEHFSYYLRGNLDSIKQQGLIPFEKEMQHVRNYLYLEKMRFEERLNIEYAIETEDFMMPALCLQPIVENAVHYGIGQKRRGGTIMIGTKRAGEDIVITVHDDGAGFDTAVPFKADKSHIGLGNVRDRLSAQCKGTLEIQSRPGLGTTVKIVLPQLGAGGQML